MVGLVGKGFYCKKCGKPMYLVVESEKLSNGARRINYYYKCLICGYRIDTEQVHMSINRELLLVRRKVRILAIPSS